MLKRQDEGLGDGFVGFSWVEFGRSLNLVGWIWISGQMQRVGLRNDFGRDIW
ncbi:hypothetical protein DsansV1_C09g0093751 [Dioscorea sansibarensis]